MPVGTIDYPGAVDALANFGLGKNQASTTLSGPVLAGDLIIPVADPSQLPSSGIGVLQEMTTVSLGGQNFLVPAGPLEVFFYSGVSGNDLTVPVGGRGKGGTIARDYPAGTYVQIRIVADHLSLLGEAILALEAKLGPGAEIQTRVSTLAGQTVSGHRAVYINGASGAIYADNENYFDATGITLNAALIGEPVEVVICGPVTEPSWSWSPGPVYLSTNGLLTQTAPASGVVLEIGNAITPTTMLVRIQSPIL